MVIVPNSQFDDPDAHKLKIANLKKMTQTLAYKSFDSSFIDAKRVDFDIKLS